MFCRQLILRILPKLNRHNAAGNHNNQPWLWWYTLSGLLYCRPSTANTSFYNSIRVFKFKTLNKTKNVLFYLLLCLSLRLWLESVL